MRRAAATLALLALLGARGPAAAQERPCSILTPASCGAPGIEEGLGRFTANVDLLNAAARALIDRALDDRLGALTVEFKTFEVAGADRDGLGFSYRYRKDIARSAFDTDNVDLTGYAASLEAEGNVAFEPDINPRDFLLADATFGWFGSYGGVRGRLDPAAAERLGTMVDAIALSPLPPSQNPQAQEAFDIIAGQLSTQVFLSLALNVALESDQAFGQKQYTFGGSFGVDVKPWNPSSTLAQLNIFDWPFALLRYLTNADPEIRPRGSAFPSLLISLDYVDPQDDSLRVALSELDPFPRLALEAGYRTIAARSAAGPVYFESNLRLYRELGASSAIEAAGFDALAYFVAALTLENGMFVSYSTGRLPFDRLDEHVYELGFRYRF